jgi:HEAT repeat protein/cyclophilin family peptidyl-prolyl cis-trans isomerase
MTGRDRFFPVRRVAAAAFLLLASLPLMGGSCATAPPPAPPRVSYEEKIAWILWLEDQRILRDPTPAPTPAPTPTPQKKRGPALTPPPPDAVPDLVKLAADADPRIRRRAGIALGRVGLPDGFDALRTLATDTDTAVREAAAFAMGIAGDVRNAPTLVTLLSDASHRLVQGRAAEALGLILEPPAGKDEPAGLRASATTQIGDLAAEMAATSVVTALPPDEMSATLAPEAEAFRLSLYALVRLRAFEPLARAVLDANQQPKFRWWPVAYALGRVNNPGAVPALITLLRADGAYAAAFAARGLGPLKDPRAVEPLIAAATKEPRPAVRFRAVEALGLLGDARAAAPLTTLLGDRSLDPTLRLQIVQALGRVKAQGASDLLLDLLSDPAPQMRIEAQRALAAIDPVQFVTVLSGMDVDSDWTVRAALAETLAGLDTPALAPRLRGTLDDPDARTIPAALRALVRAKAPNIETILVERLKSEDVAIRETAARLLGELKPANAVAALTAAWTAAEGDPSSDVREAILGALEALKAPEAKDFATRALADREWSTRLRAAALLERLDSTSTADVQRPAPPRLERAAYATLTAPPVSPHAFIDTSRGTIEIELAVLDAPMTCNNFATLARKGFYNGLRFHRVLGDFVAQTGDPRGDGSGGPGYSIRDELNDLPYLRGTIGMALSGKDTGGSQFFLTRSPQPHLDAKYTVFARVVTGMDVVDRLQQGDTIERIRVWDGVTMSRR